MATDIPGIDDNMVLHIIRRHRLDSFNYFDISEKRCPFC